jgi:hypothetical protein
LQQPPKQVNIDATQLQHKCEGNIIATKWQQNVNKVATQCQQRGTPRPSGDNNDFATNSTKQQQFGNVIATNLQHNCNTFAT